MKAARLGLFRAQIAQSYAVLRGVGLGRETNRFVTYPRGLAADVRHVSYLEEYRYYTANRLFDISLTDGSLMQFKPPQERENDYSFCYYQTPLETRSYEEFVREVFGDLVGEGDVGDE